jgi:hypothetical protein
MLRFITMEAFGHTMNGFIPQQSTCPRCGIQRTVRMGFSDISLCLNCRARWGALRDLLDPPTPAPPGLEHAPAYPFTPSELDRLEIYRRAIAAGFYRD